MKTFCFEVWKNEKKIALAGLPDTGVLSFILTWAGRLPNASAVSAAASNAISDLTLHVGGLDTSGPDKFVTWVREEANHDLRLGDEFRIRLIASETPDAPQDERLSEVTTKKTGNVRQTKCSFCAQMRQTEPKNFLAGGVMGANDFICTRCIVLAEQMLNDEKLNRIFYLSRTTLKICSFCMLDTSPETASGGDACICKSCIDSILEN